MFSLFSFEDEDLAKIKKSVLILSSLILIGWWYGLSIDLEKIPLIGAGTIPKISFHAFLWPFLVYFLLRLGMTFWWTWPKLGLDFYKLSLNSDEVISTLNRELSSFNQSVASVRNQIASMPRADGAKAIDSLPALDEFLEDVKTLAQIERSRQGDRSPTREQGETHSKILSKYPAELGVSQYSNVPEIAKLLKRSLSNLQSIEQHQLTLESILSRDVEKVQKALSRFGTSAETVISRQRIELLFFGLCFPCIYAFVALLVPLKWP